MNGYENLVERAKRVFNLDVSLAVFQYWKDQIETGKATFIKKMGPYKQLWELQYEGKTIRLVYKLPLTTIVRVNAVDGKRGNKPFEEDDND